MEIFSNEIRRTLRKKILGSPLSSIAAAVLWPLWLENPVFFTKKIASLTGNTCEALQCVILHQKDPEGACRKFKVLP